MDFVSKWLDRKRPRDYTVTLLEGKSKVSLSQVRTVEVDEVRAPISEVNESAGCRSYGAGNDAIYNTGHGLNIISPYPRAMIYKGNA